MSLASYQLNNPHQHVDDGIMLYSRGLSLIREKMTQSSCREILDLGPPSNTNLEFFKDVRCRVWIQNLYSELINYPRYQDGNLESDKRVIFNKILEDCQGVRYDLILVWDLIDYLDEETVLVLMDTLSCCCYSGTCLYLMVSTSEFISPVPSRFSLLSDKHMRYQPAGGELIVGPRHSTRSIERMLPGFSMLHSFLSAKGIQDYLWCYR